MGSLESKVKQGYSVKQRPLFKARQKSGIQPIFSKPIKNLMLQRTIYHNLDYKLQSVPHKTSIRTDDTQHSQPDLQLQNNSSAYPCSAIGIISCVIGGIIKRSTGSLIGSNTVLCSASSLFYMQNLIQTNNITFRLNYSSEECQQYYIDKIFLPEEFRNGIKNRTDPRDLFIYDYAVLILGTHVNVDKYGTLGFNFGYCISQNSNNLAVYGYQKRNGNLEIQCGRIKANVGQRVIRYSCLKAIDTAGGPIVQIKDLNYTIIGIQSDNHKQQSLFQRKGLKLNMEMFDHLCQWVTHEEEEIDLRDKELGKEGIKKLVKFKWTSLASINLARNNLGKQGLKYLTRCQWNNLHHLDIGGNDIMKEGVQYLVEIPMKNLHSLNMWGNNIEAGGAMLLLKGNWRRLNNINLYNNELDNDGVKYIINASWDELESINLGKNRIGDAGIRLLLCSTWKNIVSLNLWGNSIKDPKTISTELKKNLKRIKFLYL